MINNENESYFSNCEKKFVQIWNRPFEKTLLKYILQGTLRNIIYVLEMVLWIWTIEISVIVHR